MDFGNRGYLELSCTSSAPLRNEVKLLKGRRSQGNTSAVTEMRKEFQQYVTWIQVFLRQYKGRDKGHKVTGPLV